MQYKTQRSKLGAKRPKSKVIIKLKKMTERLKARRTKNLMHKSIDSRESWPGI